MLLASVALLLALCLGAGERWLDPFVPHHGLDATILWDLRLPRLLTAFAVGGLLAVAGAWFQVMLQNPLAEPYVLGVAGSAAAGAVGATALFPGAAAWAMSAGAFAGACIGIGIVGLFAALGPARLLLAGVVLAAFWAAVLALLLTLLPAQALGRAFGWMLGDLTDSPLPAGLLLAALAVSVLAGVGLSASMDRLLLGERQAKALGVPVRGLHLGLLFGASTMTAVAVTAAGTIGFVGLVVPHLMRMLVGPMHRWLLPASALAGGVPPVGADTAARPILAPAGPVALVVQLLVWALGFTLGFGLMITGDHHALGDGLLQALASLFTVGASHPGGAEEPAMDVAAGAVWVVVVALQIAYLPAIYAAFSRRESLVSLLESRSGLPAWGPELLVRHQLVGIVDTLPDLYASWEEWAAEVAESHTTYPVLLLFRSPEPWYSWVVGLLAVLDAAGSTAKPCALTSSIAS